ncbi:MAG: cobalamin biosynthesis protein [Magnetococcales bacterium]|nr:cobalamin biosynthesis protein [Magnetococcales bacterium]
MREQSPSVAIGLGCDRGCAPGSVETAVDKALQQVGVGRHCVRFFASITLKQDELAFTLLSTTWSIPFLWYPAEQLARVSVPSPSEVVRKYVGTPSVSEAAALLAAETDLSNLLLEKYRHRGEDGKNVTVSIAAIPTDVIERWQQERDRTGPRPAWSSLEPYSHTSDRQPHCESEEE